MKLRGEKILFVFYFLCLSAFVVKAQIGIVDRAAKIKPALVVLGTYHMANPGKDVVNPKVADITNPRTSKADS